MASVDKHAHLRQSQRLLPFYNKRANALCLVKLQTEKAGEQLRLEEGRMKCVSIREEEIAREKQRGLWAGAFIAPWDWRHRDKNTVILGASR